MWREVIRFFTFSYNVGFSILSTVQIEMDIENISFVPIVLASSWRYFWFWIRFKEKKLHLFLQQLSKLRLET